MTTTYRRAFRKEAWSIFRIVTLSLLPFLVLAEIRARAAEVVAPSGINIPDFISQGNFDFTLGGNSVWNSAINIDAPRANLSIDGNGYFVDVQTGGFSILRNFAANNNSVAIINTTFRFASPDSARNDYLIGFATDGITSNLNLSGTTFQNFNRATNRGATVLYAYANSTINLTGGATADTALTFLNNRAEWDAAGAIAVTSATLNLNGHITFDSNYTGNYGGAMTVYNFNNLVNFNGTTIFRNNHSSVFGGAIDVWGGQATLVFNGDTTFDNNYVQYEQWTENTYEKPRHVNDQHARGGAINIGYIASAGPNGTSVTFRGASTFTNNHVTSTGANANNRNAFGGAISVFGNNTNQNYNLSFEAGATFRGNYVYSANGNGNGGAIYYDTGGATLNLAGGTLFENNYASTNGGAIYLQAGTINLNATTDDIIFQGNRHGASFDAANRPIAGSGTANAIYLGSGGNLNFATGAGQTIQFHDPIASIAGSAVTVRKTGAGEVVFFGDNGVTSTYDSNIQANTTVEGGTFTLSDGVKYGSSTFGVFSVQNGGTVRGGNGGALRAGSVAVASGGTVGANGGVFTLESSSITLNGGARLAGYGSLAALSAINMTGITTADIAAGDSLTVTGVLAGAGGLNKTGDGNLVLAAANTYAGATTITAGTLMGGAENVFAASSSVTVGAGAALDVNGFNQSAVNLSGAGSLILTGAALEARISADQTFSGVVSGDGSLAKTGAGTLTLSGENTYTGGTVVSAGDVVATTGGALGTGLARIAAGSTLELRYAGDATMVNRLSGDGDLVKTGAGTATLTGAGSVVGSVDVQAGGLTLDQQGVFQTGSYRTADGAATSIGAGSQLFAGTSFVQAGTNSTLAVAVGPNNEPSITATGAALNGQLTITGFHSGVMAQASRIANQRYVVVRTTNGITGNFVDVVIEGGGSPVDFLTVSGSLSPDNLEYAIQTGLTWYAPPAEAGGNFTLTAPTDNFDVDVVLRDRTGITSGWDGQSLTKLGAGTLTLSAVNTYTGATDVQAGTLAAGVANAFAESGEVTVAAGATLALNGFNQTAQNLSGAGAVALGGATLSAIYSRDRDLSGPLSGAGSFVKSGTGTLRLTGTNQHQGGTTVAEGRLVATTGTALGGAAAAVAPNAVLELDFASPETVANSITGAGALEKTGTGAARLTGTGSAVGSVDVITGSLALEQAGLFSAGDYSVRAGAATSIGENAQLSLSGSYVQEAGGQLTVAVGQNNEPAIRAASADLNGTLVVTGFTHDMFSRASRFENSRYDVVRTTTAMAKGFDNVDIGTLVDPVDYLTGGGFLRENDTVYAVEFGLTWYTDPTDANGTFTLVDAGDAFDVDVVLQDRTGITSGWDGESLTKRGAGTLTLSAANTYTGETAVEAGTLTAGAANVYASSSAVRVDAGATLALNGFNQVAADLSGAGSVTLGGAALTVNSGAGSVFSGAISGGGRLVKSGAGTLTLSGTNTYSGGTGITDGTLTAGNAASLGGGAVTLAAAGTLRVDGFTGTFANRLSGAGALEKAGAGDIALTATGSSAGQVTVEAGTLSLAQAGAFTAGEYTTNTGAATRISANSSLVVSGAFIQEAGSSLAVAIGPSNNPGIRAGSASIAGNLDITGFGPEAFLRASAIPSHTYTVIRTTGGISGDFDTVTIDARSPVDYLTIAGAVTDDNLNYEVGMELTWYAAPNTADGTFTLTAPTDSFNVDVALRDRTGITSGWDGISLTKQGQGTLTLSAVNTYTGLTDIVAGTLAAGRTDVMVQSSEVRIGAGATLALNGFNQTANNVGGAGDVTLGTATLNAAYTQDRTLAGDISGTGALVKSGSGTLTLSGANSHSGGTTAASGRLVATSYGSLGTGTAAAAAGATVELSLAGDGDVVNRLAGAGTLLKTGAGTARLTAAGSRMGTVDVQDGSLALGQTGNFVADAFTVRAGATAGIEHTARLQLSGAYVQEAGGTLNVAVGNNEPAISAATADLNGTLNVTGFNTELFSQASRIAGNSFDVVRTTTAMVKGFDTVNISNSLVPVDYLTVGGFFRSGNLAYAIEFGLTWNADPSVADGTFTLTAPTDFFDVDIALADRSSITSGWDGRTLTKQGAGTLRLSAANTYTGATQVQAGTLAAGIANAFADSGSVLVAGGATLDLANFDQTARNLTGAGTIALGSAALTVNNATATSFSGDITGSGALVKAGTADFTLSGINIYTGGTRVTAGNLVLENGRAAGTGAINVGSTGGLVLDFAGEEILANRLAGTGTVYKTGAGTVRMTGAGSSTGAVTVQTGGMTFEQDGAFGATSYRTAAGAVTTVNESSRLEVAGTFTQETGSSLNIAVGPNNEPVITAGSADLAGTLTVSGFSASTFSRAGLLPGNRFVVIQTGNGINGDFDNLIIQDGIDPTDYLTLTGAVTGNNYELGLGLTWYAGPDRGNGVFTISCSDSFEVDVVLTDETGPFTSGWTGDTLTKRGAGTLILSSANTYTGATAVQEGTLRAGAANVIQDSSEVVVDSGATLDLAGYDQIINNLSGDGSVLLGDAFMNVVNSQNTVYGGTISGDGILVKTGTGELTLSGDNTFTGGTAINDGTLRATGGGSLGSGAVALGTGGTLDFAFAGDEVVGNRLSGTGALVKSGAGRAELTASGSAAGAVTVADGTLAFRQQGAFTADSYRTAGGAVTDVGNQSRLVVAGDFIQSAGSMLNVALGTNEPAITANATSLAGDLSITGFHSSLGRASDILGRNFTVIDSATTIQGNFTNVTIDNAGSPVDYLTVAGGIDATGFKYEVGFQLTWYLAANANGTFTLTNPEDTFDLDVVLTDRGQTFPGWDGSTLTKEGAGTLILSEQNTYTGATNINAGTLRAGVENAFADSMAVSVAAGAILDLNNFNQTARDLSGAGAITLGSATLTAVNANDTTFSGVISGTGGIRKEGTSTLTLSGDNTYSGGTTITAGQITATVGTALGSGAVGLDAGTTLELAFAGTGVETVQNTVNGDGDLVKSGTGTARLTGAGSSVGAVRVDAGTLVHDQGGVFAADSHTTATGATTVIGKDSTLAVAQTFTQDAGATLGIDVGATAAPSITAQSAAVAGRLDITGFDASLPASVLTARRHTVLQTTGGITGDFDTVDFGGQLTGVDYLVLDGMKANSDRDYTVGFTLAWYAGMADGTGSFTLLDPNNTFDVDVLLEDRTDTFASGWNGRDLTKNGDGTLILSFTNTYTGATRVTGGQLLLRADGALGGSSLLDIASGATVGLGGTSQTVGRFQAAGGSRLDTGTGAITLDAAQREAGDSAANSLGADTLAGSGSLTILGSELEVAGDNAGYTGDVLASGGSALRLAAAAGLGNAGALELAGAGDSLEFTAAPVATVGRFGKDLSGAGDVTLRANQDVTLAGDNTAFAGSFQVDIDATMRAGAAGNLGSADINTDGTLVLSSAGAWKLENTVTGAGELVKAGTGQVVVDTALQGFLGTSRIADGTLVVGDSAASGAVLGGTALTIDSRGTLAGIGRVDGDVVNDGVIASLNSLPNYAQAPAGDLSIGQLTNAGSIRLSGGAVGNTLTVRGGMASQGGRLILGTVLGGDDSPTDRLVLDGGNVTGATDVVVINRGGTGGATQVGILVIDAANGATTSGDSFRLASDGPGVRRGLGTLAAGAFDYSLVRGGVGGQANSWYLVSSGTVRPEAGTYLVDREAAENLFYHSMYDRLEGYGRGTNSLTGEEVYSKIWGRMEYARERRDADRMGLKSKTKTFAMHLGADAWTGNLNGVGVFHIGLMAGLGTSRSSTDARSASMTAKGRTTGYAAGLYATWFQDRNRRDGLYLDAWLQHSWYRNRISGHGLPGERYNSRLWSGSLEAGYAFPVLRTATSTWSLVPTVQAVYNDYIMGDLHENSGTVVRHRDCNRFVTRAGLRMKGLVAEGSRLPTEPYLEANWLHRTKSSRLAMDQHSITLDSPRNLYEVKAGLEAEVRRNLRVGLGASGQFGTAGYRRFAGQVGIRFQW